MSESAQARDLVRRIEDEILNETGNRFERIVFLDRALRPLLIKDGEFGEVEISDAETAALVGRVDLITHNHPRGTSLTVDDVLSTELLGATEISAFGAAVRYRMVRSSRVGRWPSRSEMEAVIRGLDAQVALRLQAVVHSGYLAPLEAEALHRHFRWTLFARHFAGSVDYLVERR